MTLSEISWYQNNQETETDSSRYCLIELVLSRHDKMETELAYNNNVLLRIKFKHIYTSIAKYHILFPKSSNVSDIEETKDYKACMRIKNQLGNPSKKKKKMWKIPPGHFPYFKKKRKKSGV